MDVNYPNYLMVFKPPFGLSESICAAIIKYLIRGNLKRTEICFLIVLEAGKSKLKSPAGFMSGEGLVSISKMAPECCFFWRGQKLCPHLVESKRFSQFSPALFILLYWGDSSFSVGFRDSHDNMALPKFFSPFFQILY